MIEENCFFLWVLLWDCFVVDSVFFLHVVASVLVGLCNVLSDLRFFFIHLLIFFNDLMKYNHGIFSPLFFLGDFLCLVSLRWGRFFCWMNWIVCWLSRRRICFFFYSNFFWMGLKKNFIVWKRFFMSFFIYRKHGWGTNVKVNMHIFFSAWRDFMWQEEKL